ncbi:peptidoglycan recognition family protein [Lactobacillus sp. ESL0684]|uniref:peptidoglycan recognition protein family protein n=1 Tax=Lactobacillus sp. ESL0684 TaxID=2983213 RepID=UPI0023F69426|nr:peptidoglycan recognition family protein [Lactobacillus sp. ESL0684]WEV42937.1 peptidoglycan recognition family protein [Lactobacillus sp. ESL0684]
MKINKKYALANNEGSSHIASRNFIIAHSTATPNGEAWAVAHNMKSTINSAETYVQFIVDDKSIYQVGEPGYDAWGAGSPANSMSPVQIELCEFDDKKRAIKAYQNYIELIRQMADKYGITKELDTSSKKGVKTHNWVVKNGYSNTNHVDPYQYLPKIGISKSQFAHYVKYGFSKTSKPKEKKKEVKKSVTVDVHPVVKWDVARVFVVTNKKGCNLYSDESLTKPIRTLANSSTWKVITENNGALKLGKDQFVDGRAGFTKSNPIAFNSKLGGRVKIIKKGTHALYEPKANSKKAYSLEYGKIYRFKGRNGRFLFLENSYKGKQVCVTGNNAYIIL